MRYHFTQVRIAILKKSTNIKCWRGGGEKETKAIINKWDLIKPKSFCTAEETVDKTKRLPIEWKKILSNDRLISG